LCCPNEKKNREKKRFKKQTKTILTKTNVTAASSSSDAVDECSDYRELGSGRRAITYYDPHNEKCDDHLKLGWYRFTRHAGRMMPTKCVAKFHCGAYAPGWLDGVHPMPQDGRVMRRVCFHLKGECCKEVVNIQVRNCRDFMVYHLPPTPKCPLMYCGDEVNEDGECGLSFSP